MRPPFDTGQSTIHRVRRVSLNSRDFPVLYMNKNPAFTMAGLTNAPHDPLHLMILLFYDEQAKIQPLSDRIFSVSAQVAHFHETDKLRLFS